MSQAQGSSSVIVSVEQLAQDAPSRKYPTSHVQSAKEVDPVLVVVKPLPQLLHDDVDSEPLNMLMGQTWQLATVELNSWQPYPIPHDGHWEHSTMISYGWSMRSTSSKQAKGMLIEEKRGFEERSWSR